MQYKAIQGGDDFVKARLELTKLAEQGQTLIEDKVICKKGWYGRAELSAARAA